MKLRAILLLSATLGALLPLAFSPFSWWWISLVTYSSLLYILQSVRPLLAAGCTLFFIAACGLSGISWLTNSLVMYGGVSSFFSYLVLLIICVLLALPKALFIYIATYFSHKESDKRILIIVFGIPIVEVFSSYLSGMSSWFQIGYALIDTPFASYAPLGGVYSVSLAALMVAAGVVFLLKRLWIKSLIFTTIPLVGAMFLSTIIWTTPADEKITVGVVQEDIAILEKWNPENQDAIVNQYLDSSRRVVNDGAELVIWPEAFVPFYDDAVNTHQLRGLIAPKIALLAGILQRDQLPDQGMRIYNSARLSSPVTEQSYHKSFLVPFSEYWPFRFLIEPWMPELYSKYSITPGARTQKSLSTHLSSELKSSIIGLGVSICYEIAFFRHTSGILPASGFLVNLSEDGWFGKGMFSDQISQMARMRALESGRPLIRVSNPDRSLIIDHQGKIQKRLGDGSAALTYEMVGYEGLTPAMRFGLVPFMALWLLSAFTVVIFYRLNQKRLSASTDKNDTHASSVGRT